MSQSKVYRLSYYGINLLKANAVVGGFKKKRYQKISLLLDTGSSFTILPHQILANLGYDLTQPIRYQAITTGKGNTSPLPIIKVSWFILKIRAHDFLFRGGG